MRDFSENSITEAVRERLENTDNPRSRQVFDALVRHLHAFVREVEPTQSEWEQGIRFLTETGQMCSATRQEFILLSDVLGVSMLVDAINHRLPGDATETTVLGPFYVDNPPTFELGADISCGADGTPMWVEGTVTGADGAPLPGATVDIWHSDTDGTYDVQLEGAALNMRARFTTDDNGRYYFQTVQPTFYPIPDDGPVGTMLAEQGRHPFRPAHVHFMIAAPGHETLITHVFLADDPYLDSDVVLGVKNSLIRELEPLSNEHGIESGVRLGYDFTLAADRNSAT